MKLTEVFPLFVKRKRLPEKEVAELFVEATVNSTHDEMVIGWVTLSQLCDRSKRIESYVSVVLVYATGNHQYNKRIEEFERECRKRSAR